LLVGNHVAASPAFFFLFELVLGYQGGLVGRTEVVGASDSSEKPDQVFERHLWFGFGSGEASGWCRPAADPATAVLGLLQIVSKPSAPRPSVSSMPPGGTGTREVVVVMVEQRLRAHLAHNIGHSATQLTRNGL
jgi:hypothetical protein